MAKIHQQQYFILYSIVILATLAANAHGRSFISMPRAATTTPLTVHEWAKNVNLPEGETFTKLHFYVQDLMSGPNQTVFTVAEASVTPKSATLFGLTQVLDHIATAGPDLDSPIVARVQGIHVLDDLHEAALTANWNVVFTEGEYKGSTLTLLGRLVAFARDGELSVVAGTGKFKLARGVAVKKTVAMKPHMVMEYHVYVSTPGA